MNPMDLLLRYGGYVNNSSECAALAVACVHGSIPVALLLLEHGADINLLDSNKESRTAQSTQCTRNVGVSHFHERPNGQC